MKSFCNSKSLAIAATLILLLAANTQAAESPKQTFESLFGSQIRKAAATASLLDDVKLAGDIVKTAGSDGLSDELVTVMYNAAFDLGARHSDGHALALKAMDRLTRAVPDQEINCSKKSLVLLLKRLQQARDSAGRVERAGPYADALIKTADLLAKTGNINSAVIYSRKALTVSINFKLSNNSEIRARNSRLITLQNIERRRVLLDKKIKDTPSDSASRNKLIELHLIDLDDPSAASEFLNADCDEMLQTYVSLAVKPSDQLASTSLAELAQWYVQLADGTADISKAPMLRRSEDYYVQFLDAHTENDTTRVKASLGLASVRKTLAELAESNDAAETKRPVVISRIWPCTTTRLVFAWRDAAWVKSAKGSVGTIARAGKPTARGKARITRTMGMEPSGGAFEADGSVNDKLLAACKTSNEFTIEAMIRPDQGPQSGPVRIISFSQDGRDCNFIAAQEGGALVFSLSIVDSDERKKPELLFELSEGKWNHVVITYRLEKDASTGKTTGILASYLNGRALAPHPQSGGLLADWKPMSLLFGDEYVRKRDKPGGDWRRPRDWQGQLKGIAIYSRAISLKEIAAKYKAMRAVIVQQDGAVKKDEPKKPEKPRDDKRRGKGRGGKGDGRGGKGGRR